MSVGSPQVWKHGGGAGGEVPKEDKEEQAQEKRWRMQEERRRLSLKTTAKRMDDEMDVLMAAPPARCIKENTKKLERMRARVRALEESRAKALSRSQAPTMLFDIMSDCRKTSLEAVCARSSMLPVDSVYARMVACFRGDARPQPSPLMYNSSPFSDFIAAAPSGGPKGVGAGAGSRSGARAAREELAAGGAGRETAAASRRQQGGEGEAQTHGPTKSLGSPGTLSMATVAGAKDLMRKGMMARGRPVRVGLACHSYIGHFCHMNVGPF